VPTSLCLVASRARSFTTGRIINMASEASFDPCTWGNRPANCTSVEQLRNDATTSPTGTNAMGVNASNYGLTKYLQVFHAAELARREYQYGPPAGHVSVYSVRPPSRTRSHIVPRRAATARAALLSLLPNLQQHPRASRAVAVDMGVRAQPR